MGTKIQIICTRPGMRRHGVEHPDTAVYPLDRWTDEQLAAFRADPSFHVNEIDEDGVVTRGDEFDKAVAFEVGRRVEAEAAKLQADFATAVTNAAAERTRQIQERIDALEAEKAGFPDMVKQAVDIAMADFDKATLEKLKAQQAEIESLKAAAKGRAKTS